jgi:hypothetical protein
MTSTEFRTTSISSTSYLDFSNLTYASPYPTSRNALLQCALSVNLRVLTLVCFTPKHRKHLIKNTAKGCHYDTIHAQPGNKYEQQEQLTMAVITT